MIHSIVVTPTIDGGATQCTTCTVGTVARAQSEFCSICAAGRTSNGDQTACVDCPSNTFNNQVTFHPSIHCNDCLYVLFVCSSCLLAVFSSPIFLFVHYFVSLVLPNNRMGQFAFHAGMQRILLRDQLNVLQIVNFLQKMLQVYQYISISISFDIYYLYLYIYIYIYIYISISISLYLYLYIYICICILVPN